MQTPALERVQQDLTVLQAALRDDFPYDRTYVALSGSLSVICGLIGIRALRGGDIFSSVVLLVALIAVVLIWARGVLIAKRERNVRPMRWVMGRHEAIALAVGLVGCLGYFLVIYTVLQTGGAGDKVWDFNIWNSNLMSPLFLGSGLWLVTMGLSDRTQRSMLPMGAALILTAFLFPWLDSRQGAETVLGFVLCAGGMVSTLVMWRQLRSWETANGVD